VPTVGRHRTPAPPDGYPRRYVLGQRTE